ncbi:DUF2007 domain-containing protein, partial [Bradyrhizobium sp. NBAIM08]|uniref:putative signal transducing protein n=1 Tax=Bradyrhizobium sp. NBAIM08 TaxID=2793815 RepID=UPI001CD313D6
MITLATFSKPEEAHLFRMRLEAAGIAACVQDEHIIQIDWLWSNAIGGVRVQVADQDAEAALEYLKADAPMVNHEGDVICPHCGSHHTAPDETCRRLSFLSLFLIHVPLPVPRDRYRCQNCHRAFQLTPE